MTKWPVVQLGEVLHPAQDPHRVLPDQTYPMVGVYSYGRGMFRRPAVQGSSISAKTLYRVRRGQIIYSRLKAFEGAFAVVDEQGDKGFVTNEFPTFDADPTKVNLAYLAAFFRAPGSWQAASMRSSGLGARRERLSADQLLTLPLPLPPLPDQKRIAEWVGQVLRAVDTLGELKSAASSQRDAFEASYINSVFSSRSSQKWRGTTLGDVSSMQSGVTLGRLIVGPTVRLPYLRVANVQDGSLDLSTLKEIEVRPDELDKWKLKKGDVLLTEGGDWDKLGRGAIWHGEIGECLHQNHVFRVRVSREVIDPEFLLLQTSSPGGRAYFQSAAKQTTNLASINQRQLKSFPVLLPPLGTQKQIVERINQMREKVSLAKEADIRAQNTLGVIVPAVLERIFRHAVE